MLRGQNHFQDRISDDPKVSNDKHHLENSVPDNFIVILIPYSENKPNSLRKGANKNKIFFPKNPRIIFKKKTPKTTPYKLLKTTKRKPSRTTRTTFRTRKSTTYRPPRSSTYRPPRSSTYKPPTSSTYRPPTSSTNKPRTHSTYKSQTTSTYQSTATTSTILPTTTRERTEPSGSNNDISVEIIDGDNHFHFVIAVPASDKEVNPNISSGSNNEEIAPTEINYEYIVLAESGNGDTTPPEDDNGGNTFEEGYNGETKPGEIKHLETMSEEREFKNENRKINQ